MPYEASKDTALFFTGLTAGFLAKTATAPFDRVAKLKQTGDSSYQGLNYLRMVQKIIRENRIRSMWKGNLINCLRASPTKGILFFVNDKCRGKGERHLGLNRLGDEFLAGGIAGSLSTLIMYPMDSVQVRLAGTKHATGFLQTSLKIAREGRIWEGMGPTVFGSILWWGLKFGLYRNGEMFWVTNFKSHGDRLSIGEKATTGALSALVANILVFWNNSPRQMRKTQGEKGVPIANTYIEALKIARMNGGLYRGFWAGMYRAMGSTAIQFVVFDTVREWFMQDELVLDN